MPRAPQYELQPTALLLMRRAATLDWFLANDVRVDANTVPMLNRLCDKMYLQKEVDSRFGSQTRYRYRITPRGRRIVAWRDHLDRKEEAS